MVGVEYQVVSTIQPMTLSTKITILMNTDTIIISMVTITMAIITMATKRVTNPVITATPVDMKSNPMHFAL